MQGADEGDPQAPKKDPKEYDEEDAAFLQRKKQEEAALKAAREKGQSGRCAHRPTPLIRDSLTSA